VKYWKREAWKGREWVAQFLKFLKKSPGRARCETKDSEILGQSTAPIWFSCAI